MKTAFKPDANTTVTLVKAFKKGDPLALSGTPATPTPPTAANDVCLVKLMVGPGNPGPAGAPSTSAGIGIEIWLPAPANWNKRMHVLGQGGWSGNPGISSTTIISNAMNGGYSAMAFAVDGGKISKAGIGWFGMGPTPMKSRQAEAALIGQSVASLDLAALYAAQGRTAEVRRLAEEMLPVFTSRRIHREALAALIVFLGDQLGVGSQLSTAVVVVLGIRIFGNAAAIRRHIFKA